MVIDYQQLLNVLIQILKPVIDYTSLVIDYQRRFSKNYFQESHLFKWFLHGHQRSIYMWLGTQIFFEFFITKSLILSKSKIIFILLRIPWPIHLQFNKELFECSIVQPISFKRDFFFPSFYFSKRIKRLRVSCCKEIWTQRKGCPCVVQNL